MHCHLIPRYNPKHAFEFEGLKIYDRDWGKHFHTDKAFKTSATQQAKVRDALRAALVAMFPERGQ